MRALAKDHERVRINRLIAANREAIVKHRSTDPDDFTAREPLYIRHYELLEQRDRL